MVLPLQPLQFLLGQWLKLYFLNILPFWLVPVLWYLTSLLLMTFIKKIKANKSVSFLLHLLDGVYFIFFLKKNMLRMINRKDWSGPTIDFSVIQGIVLCLFSSTSTTIRLTSLGGPVSILKIHIMSMCFKDC